MLGCSFGLSPYVVDGMALRSPGSRLVTYRKAITVSIMEPWCLSRCSDKDTGCTSRDRGFDARQGQSSFSSVQH